MWIIPVRSAHRPLRRLSTDSLSLELSIRSLSMHVVALRKSTQD